MSAVLVLGYLLAVFLTRDIWADREGTRVTVAVHTRDGSPLAADAMPQAMKDVQARLDGRGVSGAEIVSDGTNVVATFPGRDLGTDALRDMFGPGEAKTLYFRPVIHAMSVGAQTPPAGAPPSPAPAAGDPVKLIADEKQLRQSTEQNIQLLALQFQATRCDQDDALAGHDDPKLPLITCSTDGKVVYLLDRSIIGGDQVENATAGRDTQPVASCQDARVGGLVASRERARLLTRAVAPGAALLVVRVRSWAVRAWIWRWVAAGLINE